MKFKPNKRFWIAASSVLLLFSSAAIAFGIPYLWNQPVREVNRIQESLPVEKRFSAKETTELVDEKRGILVSSVGTGATIVGGIVLLVNVYLATKRLNLDTSQLEMNIRKIEDDKELTESRLISERFSRAIDQLGSDNIHVRLGGIYSLEKIAKDSPYDHWTAMEVLTAFVREESPMHWLDYNRTDEYAPDYDFDPEDEKYLPTVIQAIATVVGRREYPDTNIDLSEREKLDLAVTNLSNVRWAEANLTSVNLRYSYLQGADLQGADLRNSYLKDTRLQGANLQDADLRNANLEGAYLRDAIMEGADLRGANLRGATLRNADLSDVVLGDAELSSANMNYANLRNTNLYNTNLKYALQLKEGQLEQALLCNTGLPEGIDLCPNRDCKRLEARRK